MRRLAASILLTACCGLGLSTSETAAQLIRPANPQPLFRTLQLGVEQEIGHPVTPQERGVIRYRYAYLSGGDNTSANWVQYVSAIAPYISESHAAGIMPVFSYYQLDQSAPNHGAPTECEAELGNLTNRATMAAYYTDLVIFFRAAARASGRVILQVEPDLWGCIEQATVPAGDTDYPASGPADRVPAAVASSGVPALRGFANTAVGFAQAIIALRNRYDPRVLLGYHESYSGSHIDIALNHPTDQQVSEMAADDIAFYRSLHARFNLIFSETHDRTAGYSQVVDGTGTSRYWTSTIFRHLGTYLGDFHRALGLPIIVWQIPVGTMAMNNTPDHYRDNQLQSLLGGDSASRARLRSYAADGIVALLFGPSLPTDTPVTRSTLARIASYDRRGALPVG